MSEKLLFEMSLPGRAGVTFGEADLEDQDIESLGKHFREEPPALPEVSENEVMRHFVRMSTKNHHVDRGFYPLGSCTMKYNPKINEDMARLPGFGSLHPQQSPEEFQGALQLMWELGEWLKVIAGMEAITLQPAAGAQGEMTGALLMRAFHQANGDARDKILIPDSAHGTNPATVALAGCETVTIPSNDRGRVDIEALSEALDESVAGMMLTNPNTLGKFESDILEIVERVHDVGGLMYMDGANMNALVGLARPGDMGYDIMHYNLHKTFSTPHGGGGPGSGPVAVRAELEPFLPSPLVVRDESGGETTYRLDWDRPQSIGKVHTFFGNFGMHVRAYAYILIHGPDGLRLNTEQAILNANYIRAGLSEAYALPHGEACLHEVVFSAARQKERGARALDIAKRLLDFGIHAPTAYFPLTVPEALMIEPTETESLATLDRFIDVMLEIDRESVEDLELVTTAPHTTPVRRIDEGKASRELNVRWTPEDPPTV